MVPAESEMHWTLLPSRARARSARCSNGSFGTGARACNGVSAKKRGKVDHDYGLLFNQII